ncbi:MAG: response regulator transcription factor [Bdellovibrionota bacterium]
MANILLVDDSTDIRDAVAAVLKSEHEVSWASSLNEARNLIRDRHYDLVLLDIGLPDGDGMEFLAKMQSDLEASGTGVIFLSGTNTVPSRTRSFSLGALDYIAKPFDILEFQVRVNAKLKGRREVAREPVQNVLRQGPIEIRLDRQQAFDLSDEAPRQIDLTPVEFRLLLLFVQNVGDVVSRAKILDTVWGQTAHVSARCVDHHVCGLRKKILRAGSRIESVYGVGYRIEL